MKHNKVIAAIAAAGGLFAASSAHAIAPLVAAALASAAGAAIGNAVTQQPAQPPAVAVAPSTPAVVMGGPPTTVIEEIPAPREGYRWEQGHYELRNGANVWVGGHWVALDGTVEVQH